MECHKGILGMNHVINILVEYTTTFHPPFGFRVSNFRSAKGLFLVGFLGAKISDPWGIQAYTTQLPGDSFINHYKDPVIKQPGFHGK